MITVTGAGTIAAGSPVCLKVNHPSPTITVKFNGASVPFGTQTIAGKTKLTIRTQKSDLGYIDIEAVGGGGWASFTIGVV